MIAETDSVDVSDLVDQFMVVKETKYVNALKQLQIQRIREEIKMYQKIHQIMYEYQDKLAEFDKKRAQIVSGEVEPTDEECKYEFAEENATVEPSDEKGIPDFWLTIFSNLEMFNSNISDKDAEILRLLKDIRYEILSEPAGFKLIFEFNKNEYFTNSQLVKTYYYSDKVDPFEPLTHSQLIIDRTEGCKIDWVSPDKNVTESDGEKQDSFFNFFDPPTVRYSDADSDDQQLLSADFDMAETLYSTVIPRAIVYYTGEGIDEEYEDEEDYDEDDEFDEADDEDEQSPKISPARRHTNRRRGNASGGQPPECKNQ